MPCFGGTVVLHCVMMDGLFRVYLKEVATDVD
jgi:hypothetical protein